MSASKTARSLLCGVAFCAASCASKPPTPPPRHPPARLLVITEEHVALHANAWVELHARLAAAARTNADVPADLEAAKAAYAHAFEKDEADLLLAATFRGLGRCGDDACAFDVLQPAGLRPTFAAAFPSFVTGAWPSRAEVDFAGLERANAAIGPRLAAVLDAAKRDLDASLGPVDVVSESPPPGASALIAPALAVKGPCFTRRESALDNARVIDCLAVRALLAGDAPLRASFGERLWTVLVVHEVASLVTAFEPRHVSVDRHAVARAAPDLLAFVTDARRTGGRVSANLAERWRDRDASPSDTASH